MLQGRVNTRALEFTEKHGRAQAATAAAAASGLPFTDFALQQQMLQLHQQQVWQQQFLEEQLQKHKEMLTVEHEKQRSLLIAKHVSPRLH